MKPLSAISKVIRTIIPTANERGLRRMAPLVSHVNELEDSITPLSDDQLRGKTVEFKQRIEQGESLDDLLPEVFAVVREVSRRILGMRHFDVQILGGIVLHRGKIAEMKTGEGKTLVATLAVVLNALAGKGVHLVTVNDYLARRDADWMGQIYQFMGLSVGVIQSHAEPAEHYRAYRCDITYGTNNEFGFDFLRDNMKSSLGDFVQRGHSFAIVDEVDSILIDESRTPLIISGPSDEATDLYARVDRVMPAFRKDLDYIVDEKSHTASFTESGIAKAEKALGVENLYDPQSMQLQHHINQALRAYTLFKRDVDYVVKDGEIMIVDEFTGRLMPGRRWSDGLHQAVEAKEGVRIASENQTLATITFQNYFRMYDKLAGMTGTALTEAGEFKQIYNLDVVSVPTNQTLVRHEYADMVMKSEREKFQRVVEEIAEMHQEGRPVLVGTIAIEKSEKLSRMLKRMKIPHNILNAKHHEREADIIAQAGRKGAVTIATNMAGRGTDILLGGNPEFLARSELSDRKIDETHENHEEVYQKFLVESQEKTRQEHQDVVSAGGLHVLGTERHESRRIDNQLRGRSGRQGDPGSSRFYLSLEDDLMRIFAPERIAGIMDRLGMEEGQEIQHPLVTKAIENAQQKVEAHHFSIRKNLLEYDDVMNKQREVLYHQRATVLKSEDLTEYVEDMMVDVVEEILEAHIPPKSHPEDWDLEGLRTALKNQFNTVIDLDHPEEGELWMEESFLDFVIEEYKKLFQEKSDEIGIELMNWFQRVVLLNRIDSSWKDHLLSMDHLREGIGLRGYGQRDPLTEYKREGFDMFQGMIQRIKTDSIRDLYFYRPVTQTEIQQSRQPQQVSEGRGDIAIRQPAQNQPGSPESNDGRPVIKTVRRAENKVGRNDPCPCGSGKKYKKCCGE